LSKIFISYRREDSAAYAGRLCDHLTLRLGKDSVFMDVEDIPPGQNFAQTIDRWIGDCSTVLVVVGPKWLDCLQRRATEKDPDYVAHEIAAALTRKVTVIPVLVGGARINELTGLPPALADLSFHQAVELRDASFKEDCDRLASSLGSPRRPVKTVRLWAAGLAGVMLLLLAANWAGFGPWQAYRVRGEHIQQLLRTAQAQINASEYEQSVKTYQEVLKLDPTNISSQNLQVNAAMRWAENFHALLSEGQKAEDVAGPPIAEIISILDAGLGRTNKHDSRASDILAHLGWAHWLNEHIAYKEFGQTAEQDMRQALGIDATNVYANAMLGNWLLQKNKDFTDAVQRFNVAVGTGKERPFVRELQLAGLLSSNNPGARAELTKAANQMRIGNELIDDFFRSRVLQNYSPSTGYRDGELERTLSAVPPADSWATFVWLDNKSGDSEDIQKKIVRAYLDGIEGKRAEALTQFKALRSELKRKHYEGTIAEAVDFYIQRLGKQ
jgi:tetratricopeptide (TPR) repeat protein